MTGEREGRGWRPGRHTLIVLVAIAVIAAFRLLRDQLPSIDLQKLLSDISDTLGSWTYLLVGVAAFLETGAFVGLVAPGESIVLIGGAVAGQGQISVYLLIAITWFSAWGGDSVSFLIGRRKGRDFVLRHGRRVGITEERFTRVEGYFSRHGGKTILIGRFIGFVRALAPFTAGSSGMRYRNFVPFSILGTGLWSAAFILLGYFASRSIDKAAKIAGRGTFLFGITVGVVVSVVVIVRYLRVAENRARIVSTMEGRALLRPLVALGRRVQPQARFFWNRVTPGGLGLEFTALVAALSVGLFALIAYAAVVSADPGPTAADRTAFDFVDQIRSGWLTDLCKALTHLGAPYVVVPIGIAAAAILAGKRRWAEFWVLVAGLAITILGTVEMKDAIARPRPGNGVVHAGGFAFPSGHAAYSTVYLWLAVTAAIRVVPGWTRDAAVVCAGVAVAALIGLTRVYLHVHFLSDVLGGWALGLSAFSLCAAIAVLLSHLRQNGRANAAPRPDRA